MEFKCKNCNSTKYRQISSQVKQCEECGMLTQSKGIVDPKVLDITEEKDEKTNIKGKATELKFGPVFNQYRIYQRIEPDEKIEYYPIPWDEL